MAFIAPENRQPSGFVAPENKAPEQDTLLNRVSEGIQKVTMPIGNLVDKAMAPGMRVANEIVNLPERVPEKLSIFKPAVSAAVAPVTLGMDVMKGVGKLQEGLDKTGEVIAEKGPQYGMNPYVAAGIGTGVSKIVDIATTLQGGAALYKVAAKAAAKQAGKKAFIAMAEDLAKLPPQPELPLGAIDDVAKPAMKLEKLTAAMKDPMTGEITSGHNTGAIQRQLWEIEKTQGSEASRAYLKEQIAKKGLLTNEGKFVSPENALKLIEGEGPAATTGFARELPFASSKSGIAPKPIDPSVKGIEFSRKDILEINKKAKAKIQVPEEQINLFDKVAKGKPTTAIEAPEKVLNKLDEQAAARVKQFNAKEIQDIDPSNPLTSRAELNKKLGALENTAVEQFKEGGVRSALSRTVSNGLKKTAEKFGIKPESLDSQVLATYLETPNKAEAFKELAARTDLTTANQVKNAADFMQRSTDDLFAKVNAIRVKNGKAPIPYRQNYMAHYNESNILSDLGLIEKVGTAEGEKLVADVVRANGNALYTRLKNVVFGHTRRRGGDYMVDGVEAYNRYVDDANNYIHMQGYVNELNASADAIATKNPNLSKYLKQQADYIAGKRDPVDAAIVDKIGNEAFKGMRQLQNNAIKNIIQGSGKVAATQLFGTLPAIATKTVPQEFITAFKEVTSPALRAFAFENSQVLKDRGLDVLERNLYKGTAEKALNNLTATFDYEVVNHAWIGEYLKQIKAGASEAQAVSKAEEFAQLTQGYTSRVNTPPLMRSQAIQAIMPLQNQQLAYARSMIHHIWQGKTLSEKALMTAKLAVSGTALGLLQQQLFGTRGESPINPVNLMPFGGVLQRGMGGPVVSSTGDFINAKSGESKLRALIRAGFLMQKPIPAGAVVGRFVENALLGKPKKGK